jgi:hypothetical protein
MFAQQLRTVTLFSQSSRYTQKSAYLFTTKHYVQCTKYDTYVIRKVFHSLLLRYNVLAGNFIYLYTLSFYFSKPVASQEKRLLKTSVTYWLG